MMPSTRDGDGDGAVCEPKCQLYWVGLHDRPAPQSPRPSGIVHSPGDAGTAPARGDNTPWLPAIGEHRRDSDVDLMAVCPDEAILGEADRTLRQLLEGRYEIQVVNVATITREEFRRTAPLAQSQARQAARHGATPDGKELDYQPEREPEPYESRQDAIFWLALAQIHPEFPSHMSEDERLVRTHIPAYQAQIALERALKGLLAAGNEGARFRRDAALMWRHIQSAKPVADRKDAQALEALLDATSVADGEGCSLTKLSEAYRAVTSFRTRPMRS